MNNTIIITRIEDIKSLMLKREPTTYILKKIDSLIEDLRKDNNERINKD